VAGLHDLFTEDLSSKLCTSFSLTFNGEELPENMELYQIEGLTDGATISLKEGESVFGLDQGLQRLTRSMSL